MHGQQNVNITAFLIFFYLQVLKSRWLSKQQHTIHKTQQLFFDWLLKLDRSSSQFSYQNFGLQNVPFTLVVTIWLLDMLIDWSISIWFRDITAPMHLGFNNGPFVPHSTSW